jgi:hypothetical protein
MSKKKVNVQKKFDSLTKDKKIEVLYNALGFMSSNNSQSELNAVARAMGIDNYYADHDFSAV